jgi:hypothetical protein
MLPAGMRFIDSRNRTGRRTIRIYDRIILISDFTLSRRCAEFMDAMGFLPVARSGGNDGLDDSNAGRDLHRPRDQRLPSGRILISMARIASATGIETVL